MTSNEVSELVKFLHEDQNDMMRLNAVNIVAELTASNDGFKLVTAENDERIIDAVVRSLKDSYDAVAGKAYVTLVNCVAKSDTFATRMIKKYEIVPIIINDVLDKQSPNSDKACMLLCNMTRLPGAAASVFSDMLDFDEECLQKLLNAFCTSDYNVHKCTLNYLAAFISNLLQLSKARKMILDKNKSYLKKLVVFLSPEYDQMRRGGVATIVKNSCFHYGENAHRWLLADESEGGVGIITHLLLPLTGGEQFSDEEMEKLPIDLQYLDEDKKREADPDIRKILVECVTMLCTEKAGRELMRQQNVHLIIDNLINWEKSCSEGCHQVVKEAENCLEILVSQETDDIDNLMEVESEKIESSEEKAE